MREKCDKKKCEDYDNKEDNNCTIFGWVDECNEYKTIKRKIRRPEMKTFRFTAFMLLLMLLPGIASSVHAQNLKVGFADPEAIISAMPEYQQIRQQLQGEVEAGQQALQTLAADFQAKVEKYQKQQPVWHTIPHDRRFVRS